MRVVKNLNKKLTPIDLGEPLPVEAYDQATFKKMYRLSLAMAQTAPEQAVDSLDLSLKLAQGGDEVEVSESEYLLLVSVVKMNPTKLINHFLGQLVKNLN